MTVSNESSRLVASSCRVQPARCSQQFVHLDSKALLDELSSITEAEPENIDLTSFATVRKDLIGPSLILHKDKGVKAYVACCIAELLNVYAPDAPYTAGELKVSLLSKPISQYCIKVLDSLVLTPHRTYFSSSSSSWLVGSKALTRLIISSTTIFLPHYREPRVLF